MSRLHLGVSRRIITPPVGGQLFGYTPDVRSVTVADDLTATAFLFRQGQEEALLVSLTVCLLQTALCDEIREKIEKETGIPARHVLLCATHTHSGPNTRGMTGWGDLDREYCDAILLPQILAAAKEAKNTAVPVTLGVGVGDSTVGINRRPLWEDNMATLGQNPWGCYDPAMTVLSFRDDGGKPVANLIHYGCHGTAAGKNTEISRDWPGIMTDALERKTGAITAFLQGTAGDVGPRISNGKTVGNMKYVEELGNIAARDACRIYDGIRVWREEGMQVAREKVKISLKPRPDWETARREYDRVKGETVNLEGQTAHYWKQILDSYETGFEERPFRTLKQVLLRLGDVAFASCPYELFSEIGLRVASKSKNPYTRILTCTNGSNGYFVTRDQICRGGYEVKMFLTAELQPYGDDADFEYVTETLRNLKAVTDCGKE